MLYLVCGVHLPLEKPHQLRRKLRLHLSVKSFACRITSFRDSYVWSGILRLVTINLSARLTAVAHRQVLLHSYGAGNIPRYRISALSRLWGSLAIGKASSTPSAKNSPPDCFFNADLQVLLLNLYTKTIGIPNGIPIVLVQVTGLEPA